MSEADSQWHTHHKYTKKEIRQLSNASDNFDMLFALPDFPTSAEFLLLVAEEFGVRKDVVRCYIILSIQWNMSQMRLLRMLGSMEAALS